jgi:hypothetical protein
MIPRRANHLRLAKSAPPARGIALRAFSLDSHRRDDGVRSALRPRAVHDAAEVGLAAD